VSVALSIAAVVLGTLPTRQPFEIEALGYGLAIMEFNASLREHVDPRLPHRRAAGRSPQDYATGACLPMAPGSP
jgi:hypothetical protein